MAIQKIGSVTVYVEDQKKAAEFWEKLGFETKYKQKMHPIKEIYWWEIGIPGSETNFSIFPKSEEPRWKYLRTSICLHCDDVISTCEMLKEKAVKIIKEPEIKDWGTSAIFKDEDGNKFFLYSNPAQS